MKKAQHAEPATKIVPAIEPSVFRKLIATLNAKRFTLDNILADAHELARERGILIVAPFPENVSLEFFDGVDSPRSFPRKAPRG